MSINSCILDKPYFYGLQVMLLTPGIQPSMGNNKQANEQASVIFLLCKKYKIPHFYRRGFET